MARRQDATGRRGVVALRRAPEALVAFAGVGYLRRVGTYDVIDCGKRAGLVLAALREGWKAVLYSGPAKVARKLSEIAHASGARVIRDGATR